VRIGIAGAGLLGRLLAWRAAREGHDVTVVDPAAGPDDRIAAGFTAAGMLSPVAELECADANVAELGWRSLALWPQWLAQLDAPVHFAQRGSLVVAHASGLRCRSAPRSFNTWSRRWRAGCSPGTSKARG